MLKALQQGLTLLVVLVVVLVIAYGLHENSRSSKRGEWIRECVLNSQMYSVYGCAQIYDESERQPMTLLQELRPKLNLEKK